MWPFGIDAAINRRLAAWEHRRAQEMGLLKPGYLLELWEIQKAEILRDAEKPLLCARLFKGENMGARPIRSCVYAKLEDVPRRPAYAIRERVSFRGDGGAVQSAHVGHCGPYGGYMWVYELLLDSCKLRSGVWEEDIRPLARED